jgi:hypothetical protein
MKEKGLALNTLASCPSLNHVDKNAYGFLAAFLSAIIVAIFSLINASRRATSKTKLTCVSCKRVTYLN